MSYINTKSNTKNKKYIKLLNNLLDIKGRDQTIFTKINNISSFDISTKFGYEYPKKILQQETFTLNLEEQDLEKLLKKIKSSNDAEEIIENYEFFKEKLFETNKILLKNPETFKEIKNTLINKLYEKIQKKSLRWQQFNRKVIDINTQDNIWPLHIATMFISVKTSRREIYAPFIMKEVSLKIQGSQLSIKSEDSWKINEKLLFILKDVGHIIHEDINLKEMKFNEILNFIGPKFNKQLKEEDLLDKFVNYKTSEIKKTFITFEKGVVLGIFKPSGGNLRKTMLQIIEKNEVDEIIDIEPDKSIYEKKLNNFIKNKSDELYKIQPSNYSQDKALSSSFIQDTIIWGPPGTGKSQVIANIIANLLMKNKSAIVMSQKKAALDVLKQRLGKISPFVLFVLNDNKMVKSEFYKPLQKFIKMVEHPTDIAKQQKQKIISNQELISLNAISKAKEEGVFKPIMQALDYFGEDIKRIKLINLLDINLEYPSLDMENTIKNYNKKLFIKNNIIAKKRFLFFKKYPKNLLKSSMAAFSIKNAYQNIDINNIKFLSKKIDENITEKMIDSVKTLKRKFLFLNDEDYISSFLGKSIIDKVNNWKISNKDWFNSYKKFANAIRAGRRLPYKFINDHIKIIRELFPIIITTPETSFINWEKKYFDYAVLDESSQMFLEIGLPILYLAKIKVLAGDREQMQPSRWFATRDFFEDEEDLPENAESLLDYAFDKGVYQVMLDKNYRSSSASLMAFSSKNFYKSQLEVIDNLNCNNKKPIEVINVNGEWGPSRINIQESEKVIQIANKNLNKYKKIIILTFNSNQRQYIEKIILESHVELQKALNDEKLMIRNIENIQGDEADLVIASIVYDPNTSMFATYIARSGGKNALNVAISRAKEKMIVVKSITSKTVGNANSEDFKIFKEWLAFLDLKPSEQKKYSKLKNEIEIMNEDVDSSFEKDVIDNIKNNIKTIKKLKLVSQFEVGSKKIDIAILNSSAKFILGIEVDGYRYHGGMGFNKYLQDFSRQEFLEAKGYKIYRITEIDWKINKEKILNKISMLIN